MKKLIVIITLIIILTSCNNPINKSQTNELKDYTFLIFMNGSDLESEHSAATGDLNEMMEVGSNDNVNIIIETGGTKRWRNNYIDSSQNQRWMVSRNKLDKLLDLGSKNMGQWQTLRDFLVWGVQHYPARKYALVLWNHGGGSISGFGYDEDYHYDTLLLVELKKALKDAYEATNTKLELIGFDACLMASIETASIVEPYTNYLIASAELEPSIGWEYSSFLKKASMNELNGMEMGKEIANGFYSDAVKYDIDDMVTLSVIDTSKVVELKSSLEDFIATANKRIFDDLTFQDFSGSLSRTESYGGQSEEEGQSNMIDLGDLMANLNDPYGQKRQEIIEKVDEAVVYQVKGKAKAQSRGISIYFPYYSKEATEYELPIYHTLEFSKVYNDFLLAYTDKSFDDASPVSMDGASTKRQNNEYKVNVSTRDIKQVCGSHIVLGQRINDNRILLYGARPMSSYDGSTGELGVNFDNSWITLNGVKVFCSITKIKQSSVEYSIPVILNGQYANIRVVYYTEGQGDYKIIGAWHGIVPNNMVIRKEIIKIKKGDTIQPILKEYNLETKVEKSINSMEFTLDEKPKITLEKLEDLEYELGFCISDFSQNQCYSEFVPIVDK